MNGYRRWPSTGTCENAMWDGWNHTPGPGYGPVNWRYCDQSVIDLGDPARRNFCQTCTARARTRVDERVARFAAQMAAGGDRAADWIDRAVALLADDYAWMWARAAEGVPLSQLREAQRNADQRAAVLAAVRAAVAALPAGARAEVA